MANQLKMDRKETVLALLRLGWSYRRIERETGVRRETVSKLDLENAGEVSRLQQRSRGAVNDRIGIEP